MSQPFVDSTVAVPLLRVTARHRALACLVLALVLSAGAGVSPCTAQDGGGSETVSGAEATDALAQAMRARGLTPPPESDLSLEDHISTRVDASSRHVSLWLAANGHVIPSETWRNANPNYCKQRARYMQGAAWMMNFKIIRLTESADGVTRNQLSVFASLTDVETGIKREQREGEASNITGEQLESEGYAADALEAAFAKMNPQPQAPDDPCGEVRLKHVSGQKVGEPFVFRAGFSGFGEALVYTWDFGDGSAPASGGQRAQHVYDAEGTYEVSVRVEGTAGGKQIEPSTGTVSVEVGGGLTLFFSSRIEQPVEGSGETFLAFRYEAEVPLTPSDDSDVHEGTAPLRNVEYVNRMMESLKRAGCTAQLRDGVLAARVVLPESASARPVEALLGPPSREAVPTVNLDCPFAAAGRINPRMWWGHFIIMHQDEAANEDFRITGWERTGDPGVVARKVYSRSRTIAGRGGQGSITEETTIEIRRE